MRIPISIDPCPIVDAVVELRFQTELTTEDLLNMLFPILYKDCPKFTPLPPSSIPINFRKEDENLRYAPCYQFENDQHFVRLGTNSLVFAVKTPYPGWEKYYTFINSVISGIDWSKGYISVFRLGLRYVNLFAYSLLDKIKVKIEINSETLLGNPLSVHVEKTNSATRVILNITNNQTITISGTNPVNIEHASTIDIDCIRDVVANDAANPKSLIDSIDSLHRLEKEEFFPLLTDGFLNSLNPKYED
jgi:uncharacterized protein (TIGR04255 family)